MGVGAWHSLASFVLHYYRLRMWVLCEWSAVEGHVAFDKAKRGSRVAKSKMKDVKSACRFQQNDQTSSLIAKLKLSGFLMSQFTKRGRKTRAIFFKKLVTSWPDSTIKRERPSS